MIKVWNVTRHEILQLLPADNWQAVYYDDKKKEKWATPLHFLALAQTTEEIFEGVGKPEDFKSRIVQTKEPYNTIVGVVFSDDGEPGITNADDNFCGLCPPQGDPQKVDTYLNSKFVKEFEDNRKNPDDVVKHLASIQ